VLPFRTWEWVDATPTNFGLKLRVIDLQARKKRLAWPDRTSDSTQPGPGDDRDMQLFQLVTFGQTRWFRPLPTDVRKGRLGFTSVPVIHVRLNAVREADVFVVSNGLPGRFRVLEFTDGERLEFQASVDDYRDVDGLQLPHLVRYEKPLRYEERISYELNVDYDEAAFTELPTLERGPFGWRRKP